MEPSSSSYWPSVAIAPNVLQPYWLIILPLDVPELIASLLLWGPSGQRWGYLWTLLFFECSNFRHWSSSRDPSSQNVELHGRGMAGEFCLKIPDFHVTFRDLLNAVNLRHGTDGFTSLPKEGVLRIFSPWNIQRLRSGLNPRTWVPKASTLPLDHRSRKPLTLTLMHCMGKTQSGFMLKQMVLIQCVSFYRCPKRRSCHGSPG